MRKLLHLVGQTCNMPSQFVIFDVVVSILNMISPHDLDFANILVAFPLQEIDFL